MLSRPAWREQLPAYLAGGAAASIIVSIFLSEVLLIAAFLALLVLARDQWRWPRVTIPLFCWLGWTLLSLAVNGHVRQGLPQVKKMFWYLMLFVVFSAIRHLYQIRWVAYGWLAGASLSALWSLQQFARKYAGAKAAHIDFYTYYNGSRITGLMGHWMTLSGHMMIALMILGTLLLFSRERWSWLIPVGLLLTASLLAAFTRSMWAGATVGGAYLLWSRNKWLLLTLPAAAGLILAVNPFDVRERAITIVAPHDGQVDSNEHRQVLRRVGWRMIQAHPLFGVGPEQVKSQFLNYLPPDAPHPIPKEWYYDHLHNIYAHFGAERGLPALAALLWMMGLAIWDFARGLGRTSSSRKWVLHGAIAVILAVMVSGWGEVNLGDSEVLGLVLAAIACGYSSLAEPAEA